MKARIKPFKDIEWISLGYKKKNKRERKVELPLFCFEDGQNVCVGTPDSMETIVNLMGNTPAVDWKETATEHMFKADLPGMEKEDVQVEIEDGRTLRISGQRKKEEVQRTDTWHQVERSSGQFMRKFRLPDGANVDAVTAKVVGGVLTVHVPKVEKKKPVSRIIEIGGWEEPAAINQDGASKLE